MNSIIPEIKDGRLYFQFHLLELTIFLDSFSQITHLVQVLDPVASSYRNFPDPPCLKNNASRHSRGPFQGGFLTCLIIDIFATGIGCNPTPLPEGRGLCVYQER